MTDFTHAEFREIVLELMADGVDAFVVKPGVNFYDPDTLQNTEAAPVEHATNLIFVVPSESNLVGFEKESGDENYKVNKWAIIDYSGEVNAGDRIRIVSDYFTVTGVVTVNTLGSVLFHRLKLAQ